MKSRVRRGRLWKEMNIETLLERTSDCNSYFDDVFVDADRRAREGQSEGFTYAFSHQLHKEIAIFEIFLSILYR